MQALNHLPPYQTEMVRAVSREIRELDRDASQILAAFDGGFDPSADPAAACALLVDHLCMRRNKRCLLAYHRVRLDKIEAMSWKGQDVLNAEHAANSTQDALVGGDRGVYNSLSPEEEEFARQHNDLLAAHKGQWTDVDLAGSLEPPQDLFIDVRVLKDAGEIQTEYGYVTPRIMRLLELNHRSSITLTKNSQFYVRQSDVEHLISQKYLQKLG